MNKELEALNRLISFDKECNYISQEMKDDFNLVEKALKRNEPMKVNLEPILYSDFYGCPKCKGIFLERWHNYCPDCGQELDWSDDEKTN